jgi:hypothetical protein
MARFTGSFAEGEKQPTNNDRNESEPTGDRPSEADLKLVDLALRK